MWRQQTETSAKVHSKCLTRMYKYCVIVNFWMFVGLLATLVTFGAKQFLLDAFWPIRSIGVRFALPSPPLCRFGASASGRDSCAEVGAGNSQLEGRVPAALGHAGLPSERLLRDAWRGWTSSKLPYNASI